MGYSKHRPKRDVRAVFPVRPFPRRRLRTLHLGNSEFRRHLLAHLGRLQTSVTFSLAAVGLLHRAAQAYLRAVAGEAKRGARLRRGSVATRQDWLLAARLHQPPTRSESE